MKRSIAMISLLVLMAGCASVPEPSSRDGRDTPESSISRLPPADLQTISEKIMDSLLASHAIGRTRPTLALGNIKNKTSEEVDIKSITEKIRTQLDQSGRVRLVEDATGEIPIKEQDISSSRSSDRSSRKKFAKLKADGYRLTAIIDYNRDKNLRDYPYQLTLSLADLDTGELIWAEGRPVNKMAR